MVVGFSIGGGRRSWGRAAAISVSAPCLDLDRDGEGGLLRCGWRSSAKGPAVLHVASGLVCVLGLTSCVDAFVGLGKLPVVDEIYVGLTGGRIALHASTPLPGVISLGRY